MCVLFVEDDRLLFDVFVFLLKNVNFMVDCVYLGVDVFVIFRVG